MSYSFLGQTFDPSFPPPEPPDPPALPPVPPDPPPAPPSTQGGNGAGGGGLGDRAKAWWEDRSDLEKGAVIAGGLTLLGLAAYAIASGPRVKVEQAPPPAMKANVRRGSGRPGSKKYAEALLREALAEHRDAKRAGDAQDRRDARKYLRGKLDRYQNVGGDDEALIRRVESELSYKPNLSRAERSSVRGARPGEKVRVDGRLVPVGKIIETPSGARLGHRVPPKKYRRKGARRPQDYAWPAGYKYPLIFRTKTGKLKGKETRKHIRAASSYFARNKHRYPPAVRREIARNINRAKKRYGIGGCPVRA